MACFRLRPDCVKCGRERRKADRTPPSNTLHPVRLIPSEAEPDPAGGGGGAVGREGAALTSEVGAWIRLDLVIKIVYYALFWDYQYTEFYNLFIIIMWQKSYEMFLFFHAHLPCWGMSVNLC